jgi:NAD(P)-dependent dehydrogenase (short-subunit alcohol dehydrogenase family)
MSLSAFQLNGKTAFVTGSHRGLGAAIAFGLAQARADVACHGHSSDPGTICASCTHEHGVFARFRYNDLKEAARGCGGRGCYANSIEREQVWRRPRGGAEEHSSQAGRDA